MTTTADRVRELVAPLVADADLDLYDLDLAGGVLSVLVDAPGGADIDAISRLARTISRALDEHDPIARAATPSRSAAPGLERPLRTPAHYAGAVGTTVKVKTQARHRGRAPGRGHHRRRRRRPRSPSAPPTATSAPLRLRRHRASPHHLRVGRPPARSGR